MRKDVVEDSVRAAKGTTAAAKAILALAGKLPEYPAAPVARAADRAEAELAPAALLEALAQLSNWLEVLNSPSVWVVARTVPFMSLAVAVIAYSYQKQAVKKTLIEGTFLLAQGAYLQSIREFATRSQQQFPNQAGASAAIAAQIESLAAPASDEEALEVWFCFHESKLAKPFNRILQARLQESGLMVATAQLLTERVSRGTFRYLRETASQVWDKVQRLQALLQESYPGELGLYASLDRYLQREIARPPLAKVFAEDFCFADIYVPLQVPPRERAASPNPVERWVEEFLAREEATILFIQAGPGCGKSVFCRMFADKVWREFHPIWTPVVLPLQDIEILGPTFAETLRLNLRGAFARENCLLESNTRFLFLLDGFDEQSPHQRSTAALSRLLAQIAQFQQEYSGSGGRSNKHHRIILTGRPLALESIEPALLNQLERVEIALMDGGCQARWLKRWDTANGRALAAGFREFLGRCPQVVRALAREPLFLYLLAAMQRDGKLTLAMLAPLMGEESCEAPRNPAAQARASIYRWAIDWMLEKLGLDPIAQPLGLSVEALQEVLQEAGLCAVQAGRNYARLSAIESRLEPAIATMLEEAAARNPETSGLTNAITALHAHTETEVVLEFAHASFGEFLCAERLVAAMVTWTQKSGQRQQANLLPDAEVWWQVYDLLGYGHLSQEILAGVMALLHEKKRDRAGLFLTLGERLQDFYWCWSRGDFIEGRYETLPQRKAALLRAQGLDEGQRAVDIYAGFNALKLLFALHQWGVPFHPCSEPKTEMLERDRLLRLLGYGTCLGAATFGRELGPYLSEADLREVNLAGTDLRGANLYGANLSRADLERADLARANLSGANLSGASLRRANLNGANLREANPIRADLSSANLRAADLRGASLIQAIFSGADLSGADLSGADLRETNLSGADLCKANLGGASLIEADLREARLRETKLLGVDLSKANLSGANLSRANLSRTNLSVANLREAKLRAANLREADLFKADLFKATLNRVNLIGAKLIRANLREADLFKANLGRANLIGANLTGTNLVGVDLLGANLRGANLSGAKYSARETRFPEGFNIRAARLVRLED